MTSLAARAVDWMKHHVPTRERIERSRFLRPVAHRLLHSELWRLTRRSVPRGVALGLFVGVMIPLAHFVVAAFLAIFVRANIPAAMLATFVGFPVIYVFIVVLAHRIGEWLLHVDAATQIQPLSATMQVTETGGFLQRMTGATMTTALGLFVIATVLAAVGYIATGFGWRWWIGRKRRRRVERAAATLSRAVS